MHGRVHQVLGKLDIAADRKGLQKTGYILTELLSPSA
jgi:hypothetical protein